MQVAVESFDVRMQRGGAETVREMCRFLIASGIANPARLRHRADVQELIRVLRHPVEFADKLDPYVRSRFTKLWTGAQSDLSIE